MVERSATLLDRTYAALANPIRREMLDRLRSGPMRVTDIAAPFDVSLAAASRHLRVLETAGLISRSVRGRDHFLSLDPRPLAGAREWIDSYRRFWSSRLDALEKHLRSRR